MKIARLSTNTFYCIGIKYMLQQIAYACVFSIKKVPPHLPSA